MIQITQTAPLDANAGLTQNVSLGSFNGYQGVNNPTAQTNQDEPPKSPALFWIIVIALAFLIYGNRR